LPGVDDGPADEAAALALARAAARAGTHTIVATPHRSRRWRTEPAAVAEGVARMRDLYERDGIDIELLTGGEVAIDEAERLGDATLTGFRLGGGPYLLVESPYEFAGIELERTIAGLLERGHGVVLAHPERCPAFIDRPRRLRDLVDRGALCSVTAGALAGHFGTASRWFALELLRDGLAHSVDSDAHDAAQRPPGLSDGLRAAAAQLPSLGRLAPWLAEAVPEAILRGDPLPARPD
jgi:protein-tyrosine phosphatase